MSASSRRRSAAAYAKRVDAERRQRDLTADPATFNDSELNGAIYSLQTKLNSREARLYGREDETVKARIRELMNESNRRKGYAQ
jgi:hypothetical protein